MALLGGQEFMSELFNKASKTKLPEQKHDKSTSRATKSLKSD